MSGRCRLPALALGAMLAIGTGSASAETRRPPAAGDAGMVVTGDREAPQVLTIVPWQEPATIELAPLTAGGGLPTVLDDERPLSEDPLSKPLPASLPGRSR